MVYFSPCQSRQESQYPDEPIFYAWSVAFISQILMGIESREVNPRR